MIKQSQGQEINIKKHEFCENGFVCVNTVVDKRTKLETIIANANKEKPIIKLIEIAIIKTQFII